MESIISAPNPTLVCLSPLTFRREILVQMETHERQQVLDRLVSSEARLLQLLDGLTPAQWNFRESPERWSIAENVEHLVLFEEFIMQAVTRSLKTAAEPDKRTSASEKQHLVLGLANARHIKFNSREVVRPAGRWTDTAELVAELRNARARTIAFATQTQADLCEHFFAHIAFGDLDCYQWLLLMGQHTLRHLLQIEAVRADPAYPAAD